MWSKIIENSDYTAQITLSHGSVMASIMCKNSYYQEKSNGLWLTVLDKSFWGFFKSHEQKMIAAHKWIKEQLDLIEKYGTAIITRPEEMTDYLRDKIKKETK